MAARQRQRPLGAQLVGIGSQLRPARRRQIGLLQGEFFKADKVQALQCCVRLGSAEAREGLPQRKEIEPGAESVSATTNSGRG